MLSSTSKKYLIAGVIGLVTVAGAAAYLQYKKIMNYVITVKNVVINSISLNLIDFTLNLNFENKSSVAFIIKSQSYNVYINNSFISKLDNNTPINIAPKSISVIPLKVKTKPSAILENIKLNITDILLKPELVIIKVVAKLKVKLWIIDVNIPFTYSENLKTLKENK
jgi:LEA14-like dessication related protein